MVASTEVSGSEKADTFVTSAIEDDAGGGVEGYESGRSLGASLSSEQSDKIRSEGRAAVEPRIEPVMVAGCPTLKNMDRTSSLVVGLCDSSVSKNPNVLHE